MLRRAGACKWVLRRSWRPGSTRTVAVGEPISARQVSRRARIDGVGLHPRRGITMVQRVREVELMPRIEKFGEPLRSGREAVNDQAQLGALDPAGLRR
jgi:hypothetical protein